MVARLEFCVPEEANPHWCGLQVLSMLPGPGREGCNKSQETVHGDTALPAAALSQVAGESPGELLPRHKLSTLASWGGFRGRGAGQRKKQAVGAVRGHRESRRQACSVGMSGQPGSLKGCGPWWWDQFRVL